MEEQLVQWYNEIIKKNLNVTAKMIRDKAVEISNDKDFLASKGWLEKFKKKNGIQIFNNKRSRKYYSVDNENNSGNNSINFTFNNNNNRNDSEKREDKDDYEINIINENKGKLMYSDEENKRIMQSLNQEFCGKENTNSNIINDSES